MIECEKQSNGQGLGWISTGVLVLFAFLMTLPFADQGVASSSISHAQMDMIVAPSERLKLGGLAEVEPCDHHENATKHTAQTVNISSFCVTSGHVDHGTHICCFQSTKADHTILRRDLPAIEKPVFTGSSRAFLGLSIDVKHGTFAVAFDRSQSDTPQLGGLIGAAAEFLRTQRLLT